MERDAELQIIRRAYAKQVLAAAEVADARLETAFAAVRREDFLGPGPWLILRWPERYVATPDADPVYLYSNDLVALIPKRWINNGQPSLHAALIAEAMPQPGDHVVHIGAGTGYYTAILAHLVAPSRGTSRR
jgi:protein-L-isoaspartate(D-aspartate) O-methyltransferase